jgi:hypothetical protein
VTRVDLDATARRLPSTAHEVLVRRRRNGQLPRRSRKVRRRPWRFVLVAAQGKYVGLGIYTGAASGMCLIGRARVKRAQPSAQQTRTILL